MFAYSREVEKGAALRDHPTHRGDPCEDTAARANLVWTKWNYCAALAFLEDPFTSTDALYSRPIPTFAIDDISTL